MDHTEAVSQAAVEKYLLGELSPEMRDSFEEHYFGCDECSLELRSTALFLAEAKQQLAWPARAQAAMKPARSLFNLSAFLRPMFAVPVMAALLGVIGFQNLVTLPHLQDHAAEVLRPQVLPTVALVGGGSRGGEVRTVVTNGQQPFMLSVDVPTSSNYSEYVCSLYSPSGKVIWTITVPPSQAADALSIVVPAESAQAGDNTLLVQGVPAGAANQNPVDLVRYRFLLQIR